MQKRSFRIQYLTATAASISCASYGAFLSWTGPTLPKLESEDSPVPLTPDEGSWVASINSLTMVVAILASGCFVDVVGRKMLLLASAVPLLMWCLMVAFASSYGELLTARAIGSLGGGLVVTVGPVYLTEVADPEIRGRIVAIHLVLTQIGCLIINCIAPYTSISTASFICSSIPVLFFITFVWMPESPCFLVIRCRQQEAEKTLLKLKGNLSTEEIKSEIDAIDVTLRLKQETKGKLRDLIFIQVHRRTLMLMTGFILLQMSSGVVALMTYTNNIFEASGSQIDANLSSIIVVVVQLVTSMVAVAIIDYFGRRTLAMASFVACAICLTAEGAYFYINNVQGAVPSAFAWVPLTALIGFHVSFGLGVGPVVYPLIGEIYHVSVKGVAASIKSLLLALHSFVQKKLFQVVSDSLGQCWTFWGFAVMCACGAIYTYLLLPETKGRTFAQINEDLNARFGGSAVLEIPGDLTKPEQKDGEV